MTMKAMCLAAAIGTALALGAGGGSGETTRDLEEAAAAASGTPGELIPSCPDAPTVDRLKEAGIPFGPCDPLPEEGTTMRVAEPEAEEAPSAGDVICPAVILGKGVDLTVSIPCARGAEILTAGAVKIDGAYCARVTYVARTGAPPRTETLCEGDVPSVGGEPVSGPLAAAAGGR